MYKFVCVCVCVQILVAKGYTSDKEGTPLHYAIILNDDWMIDQIIARDNTTVNAKDNV